LTVFSPVARYGERLERLVREQQAAVGEPEPLPRPFEEAAVSGPRRLSA
jgi:hypothetical protein